MKTYLVCNSKACLITLEEIPLETQKRIYDNLDPELLAFLQ